MHNITSKFCLPAWELMCVFKTANLLTILNILPLQKKILNGLSI